MAPLDDAVVEAPEAAPVDPHDANDIGPPNPMPALAPDEYDGLKESIRKHGVLYPIVVDTDANIIDGFNRVAIVRDLKTSALRVVVLIPSDSDLTPAKLNPAVTKAFPETRRVLNNGSRSWENTDPAITYRRVPQGVDMKEYARTLNLDRRHLTKAQRLELTADLVTRGASTRTIAVATGVSQSQADRDVKKVQKSGDPSGSPAPAKVTGKDGKSYPAKAKPKKPAAPKPAAAASPLHLAIEGKRVKRNDGMVALMEGDGTWVVHQTVTEDELMPTSRGHVAAPHAICGAYEGLAMARKARTKPNAEGEGYQWFTDEPVNCPQCLDAAASVEPKVSTPKIDLLKDYAAQERSLQAAEAKKKAPAKPKAPAAPKPADEYKWEFYATVAANHGITPQEAYEIHEECKAADHELYSRHMRKVREDDRKVEAQS